MAESDHIFCDLFLILRRRPAPREGSRDDAQRGLTAYTMSFSVGSRVTVEGYCDVGVHPPGQPPVLLMLVACAG